MMQNEWAYVQSLVESKVCTGSCVFGMRDEDTCGCRCKGEYHGLALRAIEAGSSGDLLAGNFFHEKQTCHCGFVVVETQGVVIGRVEEGKYLVQYFEWLLGQPSTRGVRALDEMADWDFFSSGADMTFHWDYRGVSKAQDRHFDRCTSSDSKSTVTA